MGFPTRPSEPTATRFLRSAVSWIDARSSAIAAFLAVARSRLVELLTELPSDGSALRKLEEQLHREVGKCLDLVTAAALRAAHSSQETLGWVGLMLEVNPYLRLQDSREEPLISFLGARQARVSQTVWNFGSTAQRDYSWMLSGCAPPGHGGLWASTDVLCTNETHL